jgi:peptide/nickel transport system permease protein
VKVADPILEVEGLTIRIPRVYGPMPVVKEASFTVRRGEAMGLVGESGCGKTLTGLSVMGLLPRGVEASGRIRWKGQDLLALPARARRPLLGREIAMVYQDALSSLNPGMTVRRQLRQVLPHSGRGRERARDLLETVGLPVNRVMRAYPHQLSGGQRQRVLIALALSQEPELVIADEPTTALDETVQAQVVELLRRLQRDLGFSIVLITHNLALVKDFCERTCVLYAGQLLEQGATRVLMRDPRLPYTKGLIDSIASLEQLERPSKTIAGVVPSPHEFPQGCRFAPRCSRVVEACLTEPPRMEKVAEDHTVACHNPHCPRSDDNGRRI